MTRLWALGMPLDQVIAATTRNPAIALREQDKIGSLKPGMRADVTILQMVQGDWQMQDGSGEVLKVNTRLVPDCVVRAGEVIQSKRTYVRDVWQTPLPAAAE